MNIRIFEPKAPLPGAGYLCVYDVVEADASILARSFAAGRNIHDVEEGVWPFDINDFVIEEYDREPDLGTDSCQGCGVLLSLVMVSKDSGMCTDCHARLIDIPF
jgi:hypothetical protein